MRWTLLHNKDIRIIKRFALLPIRIDYEVRWLETVYIRQEYYNGWHNDGFVDKRSYLNLKGLQKGERL